MKKRRWRKRIGALLCAAALLAPALAGCTKSPARLQAPAAPASAEQPAETGQIYLYGEIHGAEKIYNEEFSLWSDYYHSGGLRHLFVELPYYAAEFLNEWMQADDDKILDALYQDWEGTLGGNPYSKELYRQIKQDCPGTIFHGTDVGHQYDSTGERFLRQLRERGQGDTERYRCAQDNVEQGRRYYKDADEEYRENAMAENFAREFDRLGGESVMGVYGAAHTGLEAREGPGAVPCMAGQLAELYGGAVHSEDLSWLSREIDPVRTGKMELAGKEYQAACFGRQAITWNGDFASREFWRLENAYDDFKNCPKTGDVLPYDNYPMNLEAGEVFVIDYTRTDGSVVRRYYCSDGRVWENRPVTEEFTVG